MRRAYAASVVLALLLSGCSDGDAEPDDARSSWTPSGTIDTPSPSPTAEAPTEPPLPDAATEPTEAGARAFIAYYWELINYAQVTGDVAGLQRVSGPNCRGCQGGIDGITAIYAEGGHATGGDYALTVTKVNDLSRDSGRFAYEALLNVRNTPQTVVSGDGTTRELESTSNDLAVAVLWTGSAWRLDIMELQ